MDAEMREQPERLAALIDRAGSIASSVRAVVPDGFAGVTVVARGSSDHAAVYGRYLLETATGRPVSLAAPSLHTLYRIRADYRGQLVLAVSQSGSTPEIVSTLRRLCEAGGRGVAITNDFRATSRWPRRRCSTSAPGRSARSRRPRRSPRSWLPSL